MLPAPRFRRPRVFEVGAKPVSERPILVSSRIPRYLNKMLRSGAQTFTVVLNETLREDG